MEFTGEIVFAIADIKNIEVQFGIDIQPTKVIKKGQIIALGKKAPKNRWLYEIKYDGEKEYNQNLERMVSQLCERSEYINQLTQLYEEISINIYIRSDFAEIGYSLPNHILQKLSKLNCELNFYILSFGMVKT